MDAESPSQSDAPPSETTTNRRSPAVRDGMGKRLGLLIFLALPFLVVGLLMWAIAISLESQGKTVGGRPDPATTTE